MTKIVPGKYRHKKGGLYEVMCVGRNSNDCQQELVVYRSLTEGDFPVGTIWVRPLNQFQTPGRFFLIEERCSKLKGDHLWVDARNPVVLGAKICLGCFAIKGAD